MSWCLYRKNKIALSSNNDKRIEIFDKITMYPYGMSVFKVCENEMINVCNAKKTLEKKWWIVCDI